MKFGNFNCPSEVPSPHQQSPTSHGSSRGSDRFHSQQDSKTKTTAKLRKSIKKRMTRLAVDNNKLDGVDDKWNEKKNDVFGQILKELGSNGRRSNVNGNFSSNRANVSQSLNVSNKRRMPTGTSKAGALWQNSYRNPNSSSQ
ncbi:hypothetical protein IV203_026208 [Nitzschia inconspicua]|uniref:Uncharacterized protein n=1 Tax=Nitzschia inconspicua TaxID=303405 RepID=A0A9K3PX13_9STRA|nr:hypothetical protein IV203_026208 [Nitzschia inconspicua]